MRRCSAHRRSRMRKSQACAAKSAAAAPRDAERCARRCGAAARWHAAQHHPFVPPQAEELRPEEQPHRLP
eukprot:5277204-Prymnesium_polylepis.1